MKSLVYQRKMKDLFALTNHFGNVGFNYVTLEVRKCLLYDMSVKVRSETITKRLTAPMLVY